MSSTRINVDDIRTEIVRLEAQNERIALQVADLVAHREDVEGERRKNAARLVQLRSDLRTALDAPETERRAAAAVVSLKARLDKPPSFPGDHRSPTRSRVGAELAKLDADTLISPAERLARVETLSREFADRRGLDALVFANSERR